MKSRQRRTMKKQRGGEYECPPHMPIKVCESMKERMRKKAEKERVPRLGKNIKNELMATVKLRNFRMLPESERIVRQKAYWNSYVASRNALRSSPNNNKNNNEHNFNHIHEFNETRNI